MTLLLPDAQWSRRRAALTGDLAALADGIAGDLAPVLARPLHLPVEKALLSREGGRCKRDGALLEFDPFEADRHRCPQCAEVYTGSWHRGFWLYWYHLWLAERAVHSAVLYRLRGDPRHAAFATAVLEGYATHYHEFPNSDNVLGPTRVFFSTYLESIWLLQLCIALDTLERAGHGAGDLGAGVRDRLVVPSRALIASYDEGMSNRQVWNVAALMAASRVLGDDAAVERLVRAPHGLEFLLRTGCFADGTWYEGENYHMFAHRGLWYAVAIAERAGIAIDPALIARFDRGFTAPLLTALPDMTLPSRRDSQYAVSLRQPRFAEPCELGLARFDDATLAGFLAALYDAAADVPRRDSGRARSSADVERNLPPMQLTRSDLGWRALLFARPELPAGAAAPLGSVLLEGQGIGVIRRGQGRIYAALDYGQSGGGHGHPDRLNLLLMEGDRRWLDDMGTGSYVEQVLHWYRSTLAHNAPLVDGMSQRRVDGRLAAFDEQVDAAWIEATIDDVQPGVSLRRTIVATDGYVIDELSWTAELDVIVDLPNHAPLEVLDRTPDAEGMLEYRGRGGLEDGFDFVTSRSVRWVDAGDPVAFAAANGGAMRAFAACSRPAELWHLEGPAAPGRGTHEFHVVRASGDEGRIRTVWSFDGAVEHVELHGPEIVLRMRGTRHLHERVRAGWRVGIESDTGDRRRIELGGLAANGDAAEHHAGASSGDDLFTARASRRAQPAAAADALPPLHRLPCSADLGESHYRRSECTWEAAGCPSAHLHLTSDGSRLRVRVDVAKAEPLVFVSPDAENPLDNEVPEINGDGLQLYVAAGDRRGAWTIVPVEGSRTARAQRVRGWPAFDLPQLAWTATAGGFQMTIDVDLGPALPEEVLFSAIVNETVPGRARRRGQLVLGGGDGGWIYLRGDRPDPAKFIRLAW